MSQIKKIGTRMEITPKAERLGGVLPAEAKDEAVTLGQLRAFGISASKKTYRANLTQTSTNAPVATVLENTLGDIVWSYDGVGAYTATLTGAFTANKTFIIPPYNSSNVSAANDIMYVFAMGRNDANTLYLITGERDALGAGDVVNGALYESSIEITVYQ